MRINKQLIIKCFLYSFIFLFFCALQTGIFTQVKFFGAKPNIVLCLVVSVSIFEGEKIGCIFGLICGLFLDLAFSSPLFLSGILFFTYAYFAGIISRLYLRKSIFAMFILTLGCCFLRMILNLFFLIGTWSQFDFFNAFKLYLFPEFAYTVICVPFVYFLIKFTVSKIEHNLLAK